jgi:hypothetical protein
VPFTALPAAVSQMPSVVSASISSSTSTSSASGSVRSAGAVGAPVVGVGLSSPAEMRVPFRLSVKSPLG